MGFPRQEWRKGSPFPTPGDLLNPAIEPGSPASPVLRMDSLPLSHQGKPESERPLSKSSWALFPHLASKDNITYVIGFLRGLMRKYVENIQSCASYWIRSDQISRSVLSNSLWPHESQHARPPCPSLTPGVHPDSHPSSQWCHPAISSSVVPFSSGPQSLPASESFPVSQLFTWGGQSTVVSALASFLPKKSQGWSPSEWTGWISLQSKGLSRVLSNTTVQKHQFFGAQPSSQSNSHIHIWPQEKP